MINSCSIAKLETTYSFIYSGLLKYKNDIFLGMRIKKFLGKKTEMEKIEELYKLNVYAFSKNNKNVKIKFPRSFKTRIAFHNINLYQFLKSLEFLFWQIEDNTPKNKIYKDVELLIKVLKNNIIYNLISYKKAILD